MQDRFRIIVLGCTGGPREDNITGFLLYPTEDPEQLIALDAGTLLHGMDVAHSRGNLDDFTFNFPALSPVGELFQQKLKSYLITHAHLDHLAALVINSQCDTKKQIIGIDSTIDDIRNHVFNNVIWPNLGNEGDQPLNRYTYVRIPFNERVPIAHTDMHLEAHRLSHPHEYPSTAFLIEHNDHYMVYFGDTSPDVLESEKNLEQIWHRIAPLIKANKLSGLLLECSVPDEDSGQLVYGHLNPRMMMHEFNRLQEIAQTSLHGFKVVVIHRKETLYSGKDARKMIEEELSNLNTNGLHLIFPTQGDKIIL